MNPLQSDSANCTVQVPRPDGKPDLLGLRVLDEPAAMQSDPAVLTMQLRQASKQVGHCDSSTTPQYRFWSIPKCMFDTSLNRLVFF